jgi:hypothetical protein
MSSEQVSVRCDASSGAPVTISVQGDACRQSAYRHLLAEFDLLWSRPHLVQQRRRMDYVISVIEALEKSDTSLGKASLS